MPHFGPLDWVLIYCGVWGSTLCLMCAVWWWGELA
uniref:ATP synthase F0 subunit 8 n=1 Tax=Laternula elliptica TaxID=228457 RepID=U5TTT7_LATEL|nr:ATP synthase F0 subunit 8 [Laternula elliptica]AGZ13048.1 ATP synthase F0 subunit 8 [Laternula elliptica]